MAIYDDPAGFGTWLLVNQLMTSLDQLVLKHSYHPKQDFPTGTNRNFHNEADAPVPAGPRSVHDR